MNVTVEYEDVKYTYSELCATRNGYCFDNRILDLAGIIPDVEQGITNLTYPIFFDPYTFEVRQPRRPTTKLSCHNSYIRTYEAL